MNWYAVQCLWYTEDDTGDMQAANGLVMFIKAASEDRALEIAATQHGDKEGAAFSARLCPVNEAA